MSFTTLDCALVIETSFIGLTIIFPLFAMNNLDYNLLNTTYLNKKYTTIWYCILQHIYLSLNLRVIHQKLFVRCDSC